MTCKWLVYKWKCMKMWYLIYSPLWSSDFDHFFFVSGFFGHSKVSPDGEARCTSWHLPRDFAESNGCNFPMGRFMPMLWAMPATLRVSHGGWFSSVPEKYQPCHFVKRRAAVWRCLNRQLASRDPGRMTKERLYHKTNIYGNPEEDRKVLYNNFGVQ